MTRYLLGTQASPSRAELKWPFNSGREAPPQTNLWSSPKDFFSGAGTPYSSIFTLPAVRHASQPPISSALVVRATGFPWQPTPTALPCLRTTALRFRRPCRKGGDRSCSFREGSGGRGAWTSDAPHPHHKKRKGGEGSNKTRLVPLARTGELTRSLFRNSRWDLGYGERRCGFNTKHQSGA